MDRIAAISGSFSSKIVCLFVVVFTSAFVQAKEDEVSFVKRFMNIQVLKTKSEEKVKREDEVKFISRAFLKSNGIDPASMKINSYPMTRYEIVCSSKRYVDVRIINDICINAGNCYGDHVQRIAVVREGGRLAIQPYTQPAADIYMDYVSYWFQEINRGRYEEKHCESPWP